MENQGEFKVRLGNLTRAEAGARSSEYRCEVGSAQVPTWLADEELLRLKRAPASSPISAMRSDVQKSSQAGTWWINLAALAVMLGGGYVLLFVFVPFFFNVLGGMLFEHSGKTRTCHYGETSDGGVRRCMSKTERETGLQMLDYLLERARE